MPILKGTGSNPIAIKRGSTDFMRVYMGATLRWQKPSGFTPIEFGLLYNGYCILDGRNLANTGWHVPTDAEIKVLEMYLGMTQAQADGQNMRGTDEGGKLKENGLTYWASPNTGATNEYGFNARGAGHRITAYSNVKSIGTYWSSSIFYTNYLAYRQLLVNSSQINRQLFGGKKMGASVWLLKDSTSLSHGQTGSYTGNDGKVYPTICIGTQEWLARNLAETKFNNMDDIPVVLDQTAWSALATSAMVPPDGNWNYV